MFSTAFSVGNRRPQKGHSKSENSTIVTGAVAGPRAGNPAVAISVRGGSCATIGRTEGKTAVKTTDIAEIKKRISLIIRGRVLCYYPAIRPTGSQTPLPHDLQPRMVPR